MTLVNNTDYQICMLSTAALSFPEVFGALPGAAVADEFGLCGPGSSTSVVSAIAAAAISIWMDSSPEPSAHSC